MENIICSFCGKRNEYCDDNCKIKQLNTKIQCLQIKCDIFRQMACDNIDKITKIAAILNDMFDINITNSLINIDNKNDENIFIQKLRKSVEKKIDLCVDVSKMLECQEVLKK